MVSIDAMHAMDSGFTAHYPHAGTNHREHVGRSVRVKEGNFDVRKRETEAEGREFLLRA